MQDWLEGTDRRLPRESKGKVGRVKRSRPALCGSFIVLAILLRAVVKFLMMQPKEGRIYFGSRLVGTTHHGQGGTAGRRWELESHHICSQKAGSDYLIMVHPHTCTLRNDKRKLLYFTISKILQLEIKPTLLSLSSSTSPYPRSLSTSCVLFQNLRVCSVPPVYTRL